MSYTKVVLDCLTGEEQYIPLTEQEVSEMQERLAAEAQRQENINAEMLAAAAARESARTKLAALGLTEAEVAALVK